MWMIKVKLKFGMMQMGCWRDKMKQYTKNYLLFDWTHQQNISHNLLISISGFRYSKPKSLTGKIFSSIWMLKYNFSIPLNVQCPYGIWVPSYQEALQLLLLLFVSQMYHFVWPHLEFGRTIYRNYCITIGKMNVKQNASQDLKCF